VVNVQRAVLEMKQEVRGYFDAFKFNFRDFRLSFLRGEHYFVVQKPDDRSEYSLEYLHTSSLVQNFCENQRKNIWVAEGTTIEPLLTDIERLYNTFTPSLAPQVVKYAP
jgi:hypothetical protein